MNETALPRFTGKEQVETHLHTNASLSDGAQSYQEMIDAAIERGLTSIAITNHGNAADLVDAWLYAKEKGFHLIFGIEAYVAHEQNLYGVDEKEKTVRQHLVILVKDTEGYKAFCRFISETNRNLDKTGRPVATLEMLREFFGEGTEGHGHVICSSACFAGPLAYELLLNERIDKEIAKVRGRIARSEEALGSDYKDAKIKVAGADAQIQEIDAEISILEPFAKKDFKEAKAAVKAEADPDRKQQLSEELDAEMLNSRDARDRIAELKEKAKALKESVREERKIVTKGKNKMETIESNEELIAGLEGMKKSEDELYEAARSVAKTYAEIFGNGDFYCELMYHGWEQEKKVMPQIVKIAKDLGLKTICTNDCHMARPTDLYTRELVRNISSISKGMPYNPVEAEDAELYVKTAEEKYAMLCQIIDSADAEEAILNSGQMAEECTFDSIELGKHYPKFVDADDRLRELASLGYTKAYLEDGRFVEIKSQRAGIRARYGERWSKELQERFDYEMSVISKMGFSSYFLYIADVICKCKALYGTPIGPGRGSGAGSLICYLSSITELEPIGLNLLFERFLNPERVSMPDIDTDFSKEARAFAIKYVTEFYGARKVAGIMTRAKMGPKDALTYAPKLYAKKKGYDTKAYGNIGAEMRTLVGDSSSLSEIEETIHAKYADNDDALAIWDAAKRLESTVKSYGQHAAGIISIMDSDVENWIPLMMAADEEGNDKMVIQADMVAAEANLGFIKFDFLGLKNLNVITACQRAVEERHGIFVDTYSLPLDDSKVYSEVIAKGNTNFVFQLESDGMKSMLKQLNPTCFGDLVMAVSVYRPGPMEFIPDIIRCKSSGEDSEIVKRIPILKEVLAETYGFPVYQEQVMKIMTLCAGFTTGHADNVRRFMSKKKVDKLAHEEPAFIQGCKEVNGISEEDSKWLFDQLMPFAKYGFNKSHAAAYSQVSYITAWFKYHYPAEYLTSVMLEQGDKTLQFLSECKAYGLEVLPVSVNNSAVNYSVETEGQVRIGLSAIKGLKAEAGKIVEARNEGLFTTFEDFLARCDLKSNSIDACVLSGACDQFITNREAADEYAKRYLDCFNAVESAREKMEEAKEAVSQATDEKTIKAKQRQVSAWSTKLANAEAALEACEMPRVFDLPMKAKCAYEAKFLGMWMSGSPLDDFDLSDPRFKAVSEVAPNEEFTTVGVIHDFRQVKTRNGDQMAFCQLLDKDSQNIGVVMFPRCYEKRGEELEDNMVVEITGKLTYDRDGELQIDAYSIEPAKAGQEALMIDAADVAAFRDIVLPLLKKHQAGAGLECRVANFAGQLRELAFKVSPDILDELDKGGINYCLT